MSYVNISDEAYNEFVDFLNENKVDKFNIRINFAGNACSGPVFNISISEPRDGDLTEEVKDVTFIFEKDFINQFGGFKILSDDENEGRGLSLKPVIAPAGGCASCGGGCH